MDLIQGWMRYIDDVWFVWEGSINDLHALMAALNRNDLNIKLTYKFGRFVDFLDLQIRALPEGDLVTSIYRKPTATNSLLHAESAHLPSTLEEYRRCKACANCVKTKKFSNFDGSKTYEIRSFLSCSSKGVIYHLTCPCGKIYIGLTTRELKIRIREHYLDIEKSKAVQDCANLKTLPRHYKKFHNSDPRLMQSFNGAILL
ncbi:unnamed protein product [Ranitomeya imitator]|uniref:GIY-YIG domain-containing protein n=1 Tax=Ranitomeya imitator TaxID=111125 RepID=A0ABN9MFB0_9NEOB|nr:unnamed protein product [Ranitomeya imitator]